VSTSSRRLSHAARKSIALIFAIAAVAVVLAGCGGGGSSGASSGGSSGGSYGTAVGSGTSSSSSSSGKSSIDLASSKLGKILVDSSGRTLYLFEADKGPMSACSGACAAVWPPVTTTGKPVAGSGIAASKLGTTKRSDGKTEVTYNGHPLYTYAGDSSPGQTAGQGIDGFGAEWYVLSAAGNKIDNG
jgi:predicted lipoprotein with Yx(FWY)xxD motif